MTDYTKTTDFTSKDSLPSGDSGKIIRGAEFGTEFDNIETAVNSKSNIENPSFTGNITVTGTVDGRDIAADGTKLDTVETSADVTDTANVTAAGAVMDSELTDITAVKALNQGVATTDSPTFAAVTSTGNVTVGGTVDGRDVAADGTKLDTVETNADVTDTTNVTAAGALMDSEVTNLDQVKAFDSADYATAAQGTTADNALPKTGGAMTGAITTNSTFDGRDVATDGTKLDGIEASADVTDTANVTAAGAVMDSELTSEASVKALNQGVATTDSPTFAGATVNGTVEFDGLSGTGAVTVTDILDQDDMSGNSATALATQQSIKSYVDSQVATSDTLAEVLANGNATGGTDVAFGDNDKALFGAGSELQIYHHPTDGSFIVDNGTGNLQIDASDFRVRKPDGSEAMIHANADGAVKLFYDGGATPKLATTSTGIDVTGTLVSDGLTVDGGTTLNTSSTVFANLNYSNSNLGKLSTDGINVNFEANSNLFLKANSATRAKFDGNGDISFYEDTGTTAKFQWLAASERLVLNTTGSYALDVRASGTSSAIMAQFSNVNGSDKAAIRLDANGDGELVLIDAGNNEDVVITAGGDSYFNGGNVGIGTSSPAFAAGGGLNVESSGFTSVRVNSAGRTGLDISQTTDGTAYTYLRDNASLIIGTNDTERMRIDSSGNVGIGTSSPSSPLHISDSGNSVQLRMQRDASNYWGLQLTGGNLNFQDIGSSTTPMSITSAGNVGIGTSSPQHEVDLTKALTTINQNPTLQVKNSWSGEGNNTGFDNKAIGLFSAGADTVITKIQSRYDSGANVGQIGTQTAHDFLFTTGNTERMRIDSSGTAMFKGGTTDNAIQIWESNSEIARIGGSSGTLNFLVGSTTESRMAIDSSGRVGIGTSSPSAPLSFGANLPSDGQTIHTYHSGNIRSGLGIVSGVHRLFTDSGSALSFGQVSTSDGSTYTERMRIDSSGNVGIGESDPQGLLHVDGFDYSYFSSNVGSATLDNQQGLAIGWNKSAGGGETVLIANQGAGSAGGMAFATNTSAGSYNEAMRIDSSGNLLVGKTNNTLSNDGTIIRAGGELLVTNTSDIVANFNRTGTDGAISTFYKDGTTVGSIGVLAGANLYINAQGGVGTLQAYGTTEFNWATDKIWPAIDNDKDLGDSNFRFKDLYLSGGAYLGGTGSANKLDDYEEGTWTVGFSGGSVTASNNVGEYTKIGRVVYFSYYSSSSTIASASGAAEITGLPFTVASGAQSYQPFYTSHNTFFGGSTSAGVEGYANAGNTNLVFMTRGTTTSASLVNGSTKYIMLAGFYLTTA